jgi:hypothetical protein
MTDAQYTIIEKASGSYSVEERKPDQAPSVVHGFKTGEAARDWVKAQRQRTDNPATPQG